MASISLHGIHKHFGDVTARGGRAAGHRRRRVLRAAGPERRRQDHDAARHRRPGAARRGPLRMNGEDVTAGRAGPARLRLRVPAVLAVPAPERVSTTSRSRCARRCAASPEDEIRRRVERVAATLHIERQARSARPPRLSGGEMQRVAIGRALVRAAARLPDGRAAVLARRQAARGTARGAQAPAAPERRHRGLRDARPGGGHDHWPTASRILEARRASSRSARRRRSTRRPPRVQVAQRLGSPPINVLPADWFPGEHPAGCRQRRASGPRTWSSRASGEGFECTVIESLAAQAPRDRRARAASRCARA